MADELEWESMMLGADEPSIDDEIKGMDEVSLSSRLYKTDEEIEKFTVNENLGEIDRSIWILRNGAPLQKLSIINSLGILSQELLEEFRTSVLPLLLESVSSEQPAFQRALGKFMMDFVSRGSLSTKLMHVLVPVSRKLVESRDEDVSEAWAEVFIASIKYIPIDTIIQQILPEALVDGGLAQPAPFRIWCGRVLGAVASRLDSKRIEDLFFKKALNLCQDTDYEVRKSMCNQLNVIAKGVGLKLTKSDVIPEYMELIMDEETVVREAAINNILTLLPFLDTDAKTTTMIPMWRRLCDERAQGILHLILQHHGSFLWQTRGEMTESDRKFFLSFYQSMVTSSDDTHRQMCAYNFPGIVVMYKPQNYESLKLDKVLDSLVSDPAPEVRKTIAQGVHEVVSRLGPNAFRLTKDRVVRLISSEGIDALQGILPNIEIVLKTYLSDDAAKPSGQLEDIMMSIIQKERDMVASGSLNWRTHHDILLSYRIFPDYFDSDLVYEQCVSVLFKILNENATTCIKTLVVRTLVVFMRKIKRIEHRETILKQLLDLREDRSCHQRILFFDICESILCVFSRKFFRDHVVHHYLGLSRDPVANIRLRFVSMIPMVRRTIRMPMDAQILQKLCDANEALVSRDSDRDVMVAAARVFAKYGPLEGDGYGDKAMGVIAAGALASGGSSHGGGGSNASSGADGHRDGRAAGTFGLGDMGEFASALTNTGNGASNHPVGANADIGTMLLFGGGSSSSGGKSANSGNGGGGNIIGGGSNTGTGTGSRTLLKTGSSTSLTDDYLFHQPEAYTMPNDAIDRAREEEESKMMFEQMGSEWMSKRREMHEARQELHRRFLDKDGMTMSSGKRGAMPVSGKGRLASSAAAGGGSNGNSGGVGDGVGGMMGGSGSGVGGSGSGASGSGAGSSSINRQTTSSVRKRIQGSSGSFSSNASSASLSFSRSSAVTAGSTSFSTSSAGSTASNSVNSSVSSISGGNNTNNNNIGLSVNTGNGNLSGTNSGIGMSSAGGPNDNSPLSPTVSRGFQNKVSPTNSKTSLNNTGIRSNLSGGGGGGGNNSVLSAPTSTVSAGGGEPRKPRFRAQSGNTSHGSNSMGANTSMLSNVGAFDGTSSVSGGGNGISNNTNTGNALVSGGLGMMSGRGTPGDDLRSFDQDLQNAPVVSVNLSRVGMSTSGGVSLPRMQQPKSTSSVQTRPASRPSGTEKVPELPSAGQMKKAFGRNL